MTDNYLQTSVLEYLKLCCHGRVKAVKADVLAERYQTSRREINSVIRDLRKEGNLIGSSKDKPHGYYIPANAKEVLEYMDTFKSELFDMLETFNRQKRMQRAFIENINNHQLFPTSFNEDGQMELVLGRKA
jgi:biotin operon repressor